MRMSCFRCVVLCLLLVFSGTVAGEVKTQNVILVTIDGLRQQELFRGAERPLIDRDSGGVREPEAVEQRFWADSQEQRRRRLLPFLWEQVATKGQIFGDPDQESQVLVTNGRYFSYPGYNELLCGRADPDIDSNAKRANPNVTVLEWLQQKPAYRGYVAAFTSWDVFPYILNQPRSGIYVNAGWQEIEHSRDPGDRERLNELARELPRYWSGVRYDVFTFQAALEYLHVRRPKVLYVALGETDDWAHDGRYDLYLDAAWRTDQYIRRIWEAAQQIPAYVGKTSLIITTDHGRGDGRAGWKSHGVDYPGSEGIWIAVLGPDTPPLGIRQGVKATQAQIAPTLAALLGEDFATHDDRIADALPGVLKVERGADRRP